MQQQTNSHYVISKIKNLSLADCFKVYRLESNQDSRNLMQVSAH